MGSTLVCFSLSFEPMKAAPTSVNRCVAGRAPQLDISEGLVSEVVTGIGVTSRQPHDADTPGPPPEPRLQRPSVPTPTIDLLRLPRRGEQQHGQRSD